MGPLISTDLRQGKPIDDEELIAIILQLDDQTFEHSVRTRELSLMVGKKLGLSAAELSTLGLGALLHDIGNLFIAPHIVNKASPLTEAEWSHIKEHPIRGYDYLAPLALNKAVKAIVLEHHRWSCGEGGYPRFAEAKAPDSLAQIVAVVDSFDAMINQRPYRPALLAAQAIENLQRNEGQYCLEVVKVLQKIVLPASQQLQEWGPSADGKIISSTGRLTRK